MFFAGIFLLIFIETGIHGLLYQPAIDKALFFPKNQLTGFLGNGLHNFRFTSVSDTAIFNPNVGTYYGIADIKNYDAMLAADYKEELDRYSKNVSTFETIKDIDRNYLNLAGVKYIIAKSEKELKKKLSLDTYDSGLYPEVFKREDYSVFENTSVLPRVFFADGKAIGKTMLEKGDLLPADKYRAEIMGYEPEKIEISADNSGKAVLVLTDTYFPGWKAFVDGKEMPVEKTASSFRAITLNSGEHEVIFRYKPASFVVGCFISFFAAAIVLFSLCRCNFRAKINGI